MDLRIKDKSVLVTGGSRGIGLACAELFLEEGCHVTIVGHDPDSVSSSTRRLNQACPGRVEGIDLDLGNANDIELLAGRLESADIVVNNAGAIPGGGLDNVDEAAWRKAWDLKVYGYINAVRQALPAMMERGHGVVVNVIGIAGSEPRYDYLCGSVANAALAAFTKAVGGHSTTRGVRVVGVNPGPTQTDRLVSLYRARAVERFGDAERWRETLTHLPFGRPTQPQEIADLVVYLASGRASYISGVVIDADGGGMYANR